MATRIAFGRIFIARRLLPLGLVTLVVAGAAIAVRVAGDSASGAVRTVTVTRGSVAQTVTIPGSVTAAAQLRLNFRAAGRVTAVDVTVGQRVAADQPLATLDTTELAAAVDQARGALAQAQARYDQTVAGATSQDVAIARQAVDNARRMLDNTRRVSQNEVAGADLAFARVRTNFETARTNLATLSDGLASDVARVQLDALLTQLDLARSDLNSALPPDPTPGPLGIVIPPPRVSQDGFAAQAALGQARAALLNAQLLVGGPLKDALGEYRVVASSLLDNAATFDSAVAAGGDTAAVSAAFQAAQARYATAATRLGASLDALAGQLGAMLTTMTSAQGSLEDATSRSPGIYETPRKDLTVAFATLSDNTQAAIAAKAKLQAAGAPVGTLGDAVAGSYVAAQATLATVRERSSANVVAAENGLASANATLEKVVAGARQSDLDAATAALQAARSAVAAAESNLANGTLKAPVAGVVSAVNAKVGELASPAGPPLVVLSDTSGFTIRGFVGEADIQSIQTGQAASVWIEALGLKTPLRGEVTSVDPSATMQQGVPVYGIEVTIRDEGGRVRPGMSGTAAITVSKKDGVLVVPLASLRGRGARQTVQVVGETAPREVEVGATDETVAEILSGLSAGDRIVLPSRAGTQ